VNAYNSAFRNWVVAAGTSFAAPFVTGLAGLAFTVEPDMIDNEFQSVLRSTARDVGTPGRDDVYGWGIPDAPALLAALLPPNGFLRGTVRAQSWSKVATDSVTLSKTRKAVNGCSIDGKYLAEHWEVRAHVTLPPGRMLSTPQVIVRTHGTNGNGGWPNSQLLEYDGLDFGEAVPGTVTATGFDVRTYVYLIHDSPQNCSTPSPIGYTPHQPVDVQIAWSALGILDRPPHVSILAPADGARVPVDDPTIVRWSATDTDTVTNFQVAVSRDAGATWVVIANLPGDATQYSWNAPCGEPGDSYRLRVSALDRNENFDGGEASIAFVPDRICFDGEVPASVPAFALLPPTPNPAGSGPTAFHFYLPEGTSGLSLRIYDVRGRRVRSLPMENAFSGPNATAWDGQDDDGRLAPAGMYVARLVAGSNVTTRRFIRL
jgi:hypothetical protein